MHMVINCQHNFMKKTCLSKSFVSNFAKASGQMKIFMDVQFVAMSLLAQHMSCRKVV